jgi:hypothetical protein
VGHLLDRANEVVAVARLVRDQLEEDEAKLAGFEGAPPPTATTFVAPTGLPRTAAERTARSEWATWTERPPAPNGPPGPNRIASRPGITSNSFPPHTFLNFIPIASLLQMHRRYIFSVSRQQYRCGAGTVDRIVKSANDPVVADLFQNDAPPPPQAPPENAPLADRLRPARLEEVVGQEHLTGPEGAIGRMVSAGKLASIVLWGPPGTGKTTIARLLADAVGMRFVAISAVFSGVADLKKVFAEAKEHGRLGRQTLLFVDEIHRFNRAQQDGFLPYVEDGTVVLVGATTENPSFELNAALLSRAQVMILSRLDSARSPSCSSARGAARSPPAPHLRGSRCAGRDRRWGRALSPQPGGDFVLRRSSRAAGRGGPLRPPPPPRGRL